MFCRSIWLSLIKLAAQCSQRKEFLATQADKKSRVVAPQFQSYPEPAQKSI